MFSKLIKSVREGNVNVIAMRLSGIALGFLVQLVLARTLGLEGFGEYSILLSCLSLLIIPSVLGIDTVLVRFSAEYRKSERWRALKGLVIWAFGLTVILSCALWLIAAPLVRVYYEDNSFAQDSALLWVCFAILPAWALLKLACALIQSFHKVTQAFALENVIRHLAHLLFIVAALFVAYESYDTFTVISLNLVATVLAFLMALAYLLSLLKRVNLFAVRASFQQTTWFKVALSFFLVNVFTQWLLRGDILLVGYFLDSEAAGIYAIAARFAVFAGYWLIIANMINAPRFAECNALGDYRKMETLARSAARQVLLAVLVTAAGFIVAGKFLLGVFGEPFVAGYPAMIILLVSELIAAAAGLVVVMLSMTGHHKRVALVIGAAAAINFALGTLLIPAWGIEGAAVARVLSIAFWVVVLSIELRKRLKINPTPFGSGQAT